MGQVDMQPGRAEAVIFTSQWGATSPATVSAKGRAQRERRMREWLGNLHALLALGRKIGRVNIRPGDDPLLWKWLCEQRTAKANGTLGIEREARLLEAGISLAMSNTRTLGKLRNMLNAELVNRVAALAKSEGIDPLRLMEEALRDLLEQRDRRPLLQAAE